MKLILSRKGFDSSYGGVPSPIFPDGTMWSLPIPSSAGSAACLHRFRGLALHEIASDLTGCQVAPHATFHVDPDIHESCRARPPGWRPAFGQVAAAQTHLRNQGVGPGDLFLFFGWFRHVERRADRWRYVPAFEGFHALFGWLRVGTVIGVDGVIPSAAPAWLADHPHVEHAAKFAGRGNTIYVSDDWLRPDRPAIPGGGAFTRWSPTLRLSASGYARSVWRVPAWFEPRPGQPPLSYHARPDRWIRHGNDLLLKSVAKGQEFVLNTDCYPEAHEWACKLIEDHW